MFLFSFQDFFFRKKTALRRYSNLIKGSLGSEQWPNLNASKAIHAGDFGSFDKETGNFVVEGNIYTLGKGSADLANWRPISGERHGYVVATSGHVGGCHCFGVTYYNGAHVQDVPFEGSWNFGTKHGAVLYLHQSQETYVPHEVFNTDLFDRRLLKEKWVVSAVHACPAYFMCFSDRSSKSVTAKLYRNVTKQAEESANSSHDASTFSWVVEGDAKSKSCIIQYGSQPGESYVPLFSARLIGDVSTKERQV